MLTLIIACLDNWFSLILPLYKWYTLDYEQAFKQEGEDEQAAADAKKAAEAAEAKKLEDLTKKAEKLDVGDGPKVRESYEQSVFWAIESWYG